MSRIELMSDVRQVPIVQAIIRDNYTKGIDHDSLAHTLECDICKTFIAVWDGMIVATAGIRDGKRVVWVATHRSFKRQGHALALMQSLQSIYPMLELWVKKTNTSAIFLYQKVGFIFEAEKDKDESYYMVWRKS